MIRRKVVCAFLCLAGSWAVAGVINVPGTFLGHWDGTSRYGVASAPFSIDISNTEGGVQVLYSCPITGVLQFPVSDIAMSDGVLSGKTLTWLTAFTLQIHEKDGALEGRLQSGAYETTLHLMRSTAPKPPYTTETVHFTDGDVALTGTLYVPEGKGPFPALVHLHGSGDHTRDEFRFWADHFARMGIASLAFDKRGCGESGGDWQRVGFEPLVEDGIAAVKVLLQRPDIDPKRIGMTGISQAGWLMPLAALKCPDISYLVIISGPSIPVEQEGHYDYIVALRDKGYPESVINQAKEILKMNTQVVRNGQGAEALRQRVAQVHKEQWFRDMHFVRSPEGGWYQKIVDYDPLPTLKAVNVPMLWVYGTADKSVPPGDCMEILDHLKKADGKDYTIVTIPGGNHVIHVKADPARTGVPFGVFPDAYPETVSAWLHTRVLHDE